MEFQKSLGSKLRKDCKNRVEVARFENQLSKVISKAQQIVDEYISGANKTLVASSHDDLDIILKILRNTGVPFYTKTTSIQFHIYFKTARNVDDIKE